MTDILERLRQWTDRDGETTPLGAEAADEIGRLRAIVEDACEVLKHYDLPEHAFHYQRVLKNEAPLTNQQSRDSNA